MDLFESRAAKPMLIGRIVEPFDNAGWTFEIKLDGERCLAYCDAGGVDLINRRGNRISAKMPELAGIHSQVKGRCILDGEIVAVRDGRPSFDEIKRRFSAVNPRRLALLQEQSPVSLVVFDILYKDGQRLVERSLEERREILAASVAENERISVSRSIEAQGVALFENAIEHGLEGIVAKRLGSQYQMGKRTSAWVKIKNTCDDEYVICGYIPHERVASLVLGQYDAAGAMVYKGHTTLALSGGDYRQIAALPKRKKHPFKETPPAAENRGAVWVAPKLVCTVQYMEIGSGGLMRHPVYKGLRFDKTPGEAVEAHSAEGRP